MENQRSIKEIVDSILRERFEGVDIVSINVRPDKDDDGDDILVIDVVFDGKAKSLDASKTSGLVRRMIPEIQESGVRGFPILSFIAKSELRKKRPEAA